MTTKINPILSVIVPVFNGGDYLKKALESILCQSYTDFELLIIDDCSLDDSWGVLQSYLSFDNVQIFKNDKNEGKNASVNKLLDKCLGKYITVHDADDTSHCDRFLKQIEFLESDDKCVMCGTGYYEISPRGEELNLPPNDIETIRRNLPAISQFHGPTIMFEKDVLEHVGGLYRYFTWGEDIDFTARVVEKYYATNLQEPLYTYNVHNESLTKNLFFFKPEKVVSKDLRVFLADQRKNLGYDYLLKGDIKALKRKEKELMLDVNNNIDLIYFRLANKMNYYKFYKEAFQASWKAFVFKKSMRNFKAIIFSGKEWVFNLNLS